MVFDIKQVHGIILERKIVQALRHRIGKEAWNGCDYARLGDAAISGKLLPEAAAEANAKCGIAVRSELR
ncbi:MAG: hypothetical protein NVSMB39_2920 [Candidatus Saccharimonadales bacterium]